MKMIKVIARPLLPSCNLPTRCWGHNMLHTANSLTLDRRPTTSILSCMLRRDRHRKFPTFTGSVARCMYRHYPRQSAMGSLRKSGIYVGYETVSIITYLDPDDMWLSYGPLCDRIFDEDHFLTLGGGNHPLYDKSREITWQATGSAFMTQAQLREINKSKR